MSRTLKMILHMVISYSSFLLSYTALGTNETISSTISGETIWAVRSLEDSTKSGIFSRDSTGQFNRMVISGTLLSSKTSSGVHQLDRQGSNNLRHECWAILNGKIVFFHSHSNPQDPDSIVTLNDNHKVFDLNTKQYVQIPPILSYSSITYSKMHIYSSGTNNFFADILFSVHNPYSIYSESNGLTFVVRLFHNTQQETDPFQITTTLLDDRFYNSMDKIENIWQGIPYHHLAAARKIISTLNEENPVYHAIKTMQPNENGSLPISMEVNQHLTELYPPDDLKIQINNRNRTYLHIEQTIPFDGSIPQTSFTNRSGTERISGTIDTYPNFTEEFRGTYRPNKRGATIRDSHMSQVVNENLIAFYHNGKLHLILDKKKTQPQAYRIHEGRCANNKPDTFYLYSRSYQHKNILFVSCSLGEHNYTDIYNYHVEGNHIHTSSYSPLARKVYTEDEIGDRIQSLGYDAQEKLYFDLYEANTEDEYTENSDYLLPHVDLDATLKKQSIQHKFLAPKEEIFVASMENIRHHDNLNTLPEFKKIGQQNTGLLLKNVYEEEEMITGKILSPPETLEIGKGILEVQKGVFLLTPEDANHQDRLVALWLLDPLMNGQDHQFKVVITMVDTKSGYSSFVTDTHGRPLHKLKGIYLRRESNSQPFKIIFAYEHEGEDHHEVNLHINHLNPNLSGQNVYKEPVRKIDSEQHSWTTTLQVPTGISFTELHLDQMISEQYSEKRTDPNPKLHYIGQRVPGENIDYIGFSQQSIVKAKRHLSHKVSEVMLGMDGKTEEMSVEVIDPLFDDGNSRLTRLVAKLERGSTATEVAKFNLDGGIESLRRVYLVPGDQAGTMGHILVLAIKKFSRNLNSENIEYLYHYFQAPADQRVRYPKQYTYSEPGLNLAGISSLIEPVEFYSRFMVDLEGRPIWVHNSDTTPPYNIRLYNLITRDDTRVQHIDTRYSTYYRPDQGKIKKQTHSSWSVGTPKPKASEAERKKDLDTAKVWEMFPNALQRIEDLVNPQKQPKHAVLLVNGSIKASLIQGLRALYAINDSQSLMSYRNDDLALYHLESEDRMNQTEIGRNFSSAAKAAKDGKRPLIATDLGIVSQNMIPSRVGVASPYLIEYAQMPYGHNNLGVEQVRPSITSQTEPTLLLIFATEGKEKLISAQQKIESPMDTSILIIATESEWQAHIDKIPSYEKRMGLIDHYEMIHLGAPDEQTLVNLLLTEMDTFAALMPHVEYDASSIHRESERLSESESKEKIAHYLYSKARTYAEDKKMNAATAIGDLRINLSNLLHHYYANFEGDTFVFNRRLMEQVLQETFDLPLSPDLLPESDPINQLRRPDIYLRWSAAEYDGNIEIKKKIVNGILAQTNSGYNKTIPGSFVIYGPNGTGKTLLFDSLVKMLRLTTYRMGGSEKENHHASVFRVNLAKVTETTYLPKEKKSNELTVDHLLNEFHTFLSLPNGRRGFILFDDAHLCKDTVREKVFAVIRSLFDAEKGQYHDIPVRNLTLFMTFNPTNDREKLKRVESGASENMLKVLATFMGADQKVDASFFNRWNAIIEVASFNGYGRTNELVRNLAKSSQTLLEDGHGLLLFDESAIYEFKKRFPNANARDYLSHISSSIYQHHRDLFSSESLEILIHNTNTYDRTRKDERTSLSADEVTDYINSHYQNVPIRQSGLGFLSFLQLMVNNFRQKLYSELLLGIFTANISQSEQMILNGYLTPILEAGKSHLELVHQLSIKALSLSAEQIERTMPVQGRIDWEQSIQYFTAKHPQPFSIQDYEGLLYGQSSSVYDQLFGPGYSSDPTKPLHDLISRTEGELIQLLEQRLRNETYFNQVRLPIQKQDINNWSHRIGSPQQDKSIVEMIAIFEQFQGDFQNIESNLASTGNCPWEAFSAYERFRLFAVLLDFAISKLNWSVTAGSLAFALDSVVSDLGLANLPNVKNWLFREPGSILKTKLRTDFQKVIEDVDTINLTWEDHIREQHHQGFKNNIQTLLQWLAPAYN